jgi:hypothetical protein
MQKSQKRVHQPWGNPVSIKPSFTLGTHRYTYVELLMQERLVDIVQICCPNLQKIGIA